MAKTIAIVNQKGGVGKTTTCVNLAAALKLLGIRVLVCDFDPQANTTSGLGVDKTAASPSIYDVLIDGADCRKAVVPTPWADVIPSNKALAGATVEMIGYLCMTLIASFLLRWIEKKMDGTSNYELVQEDPLVMTAGTYSHPSRKTPFDEQNREVKK